MILASVGSVPRRADAGSLPSKFSATSDLHLSVTGPARTFVELRPFGATWALACPTSRGRRRRLR